MAQIRLGRCQADLSLRGANRWLCWFCHDMAHFYYCICSLQSNTSSKYSSRYFVWVFSEVLELFLYWYLPNNIAHLQPHLWTFVTKSFWPIKPIIPPSLSFFLYILQPPLCCLSLSLWAEILSLVILLWWRVKFLNSVIYEPRQANLCLRAFRHDKL